MGMAYGSRSSHKISMQPFSSLNSDSEEHVLTMMKPRCKQPEGTAWRTGDVESLHDFRVYLLTHHGLSFLAFIEIDMRKETPSFLG